MKIPQNPPKPNTPSSDTATQQWVNTYFATKTNAARVVASPISVGPPNSPNGGDIWIATNVDANGAVWQFRYNAGSGSTFKWEFIGGTPLLNAGDPNAVINTKTQVGVTGNYYDPATMSVSILRPGDYTIQGTMEFDTNAGANGWGALSPFVGTTLGHTQVGVSIVAQAGQFSVTAGDVLRGVAVGVAGIAANASAPGTYKMRDVFVSVVPIRVS